MMGGTGQLYTPAVLPPEESLTFGAGIFFIILAHPVLKM
jgi:hypothetical protein